MRRPGYVWGGVLGGLALFDYWCAKNTTDGDSLSECCRVALRTHTPLGAAVFVGAWAGLTAWLLPHICRRVIDA